MKHGVRVPFQASGRAGSHSTMYFQMCAAKLVGYRAFADELKHPDMFAADQESLLARMEQAAVEPIVYAGMCLEATLFDLAACLYGDEFAAKTDKLDPLGRFYVLSHAVNRCVPAASSITVQKIQALVMARNSLVHHKSISWMNQEFTQILKEATKKHRKHMAGVSASFSALVLLSLHFDGNIFEELRILPSFKKPEYWATVVPTALHGDVYRCIKLAAEEHEHQA